MPTWSGDGADTVASAEPVNAEATTVYGVEFDVSVGAGPPGHRRQRADRLPDLRAGCRDLRAEHLQCGHRPQAEVRLAPEKAGPVSLVTAFAQPDVEVDEVRIVVKRAANLVPEITQRGSLLVVDFPHTGALAARPPVFRWRCG